METNNIRQTDERKNFRINDHIEISYYIVPDNTASNEIEPAILDAALFDKQSARHFKLMQKLQQLANHLFEAYSRDSQEVNISAGGVAFHAKEALADNTRLKLKIVLPHTLQGFICSARVVLCRHLPKRDAERPYRISVKFTELSEQYEQLLQRYILQQQTMRC